MVWLVRTPRLGAHSTIVIAALMFSIGAAAQPARTTAPVSTPASAAPAAPAVSAADAGIAGRVRLIAGRRQKIAPGDVDDTVVWFTPTGSAPTPEPGRYSMLTLQKSFDPDLLVIPVGSTVSFPNGDPVLHNVYSDSSANSFDLGFYGEGQTREHTFNSPGLVAVFCNVHSAMQSKILVLETPHFARADAEGNFRIAGIPAGSGTLSVWHPRAAKTTVEIDASNPAPLSLSLTLTRGRREAFRDGGAP